MARGVISTNSSAISDSVGLSKAGVSNSSNLNSVMCPAFTLGGQSALRKRVETDL